MDTALYFPYIEVPDSLWFTQILFYWNDAATIVPDGSYTHLSDNMRELHDAGLVTFIRPWDVRRLYQVEEVFLSWIERQQLVPRTQPHKYTRLHSDKVNSTVVSELRHRGLARESEVAGWWEVEELVADAYMAMLASAIAEERRTAGIPTSPVTDSVERFAHMPQAAGGTRTRIRQLRSALMSELPVPGGPIPYRELADFKLEHKEQLQRLRDHLDLRINEIATIGDAEVRSESAEIFARAVRRDLDDIGIAMDRRRWPKVVFLGVAGVASAAITTATGVVGATENSLLLGLAVGGGIIAEGTAIYNLADSLHRPLLDDSKPMAYAASVVALRPSARMLERAQRFARRAAPHY